MNDVAQTILAQINATDFMARARWGVATMLAGENELRLMLPRGRKILIALDASDTYTITIGTLKKIAYLPTWTVERELDGVHCDGLVQAIDLMLRKR